MTSDRGLIRLCLDKSNKPTDVNYYTRERTGDLSRQPTWFYRL